MCPHTTKYVSSYHYISVRALVAVGVAVDAVGVAVDAVGVACLLVAA